MRYLIMNLDFQYQNDNGKNLSFEQYLNYKETWGCSYDFIEGSDDIAEISIRFKHYVDNQCPVALVDAYQKLTILKHWRPLKANEKTEV